MPRTASRRSLRPLPDARYSIEVAAPYLMSRIVNRLNQRLVAALKTLGLTFRHWRVLAFLAAAERRTIAELAQYTVTPHSTLSRFLDRMERAGLVRRAESAHDLRAIELRLTPRGRALYERILPLALEINAQLLAGFSAAERAQLERLLARMRDNLGLDSTPGAPRERALTVRGRPPITALRPTGRKP